MYGENQFNVECRIDDLKYVIVGYSSTGIAIFVPIDPNLVCHQLKMQKRILFYIQGENIILVLIFWDYGQFGPCYFQIKVNLVITINSLTENVYVTNGLHGWHTYG